MSLDTLKRTASYEMANGSLPKNRPIEHHELLSRIVDAGAKMSDTTVEVEPIWATEKQSLRVMWSGDKSDCPVENYLVQRLVTKINFKHNSDETMNSSIGVAYHEKGITLAYGTNVWVCSNLMIAGSNVIHTFGRDKVPFEKASDLLNGWFQNFNQMRDDSYGVIERMKSKEIGEDAKNLIFGKLIENAVLHNLDTKHEAPLNISQVNELIRASHSEEYMLAVGEPTTVWDLSQWGTSFLKANQGCDMTKVMDHSIDYNNFLVKEFGLN